MKWQWLRFFLLILFIPTLLYGMGPEDTKKFLNDFLPEWEKHNLLIEQSKMSPYSAERIGLINQSISCCQKAMGQCDKIINQIRRMSDKKRREMCNYSLKGLCKHNKKILYAEINRLNFEIKRIEANISALSLYEKSLQKAEEAKQKTSECHRGRDSVGSVVTTLNEAVTLCEEAAALVNQALDLINCYPQDADKAEFRQYITRVLDKRHFRTIALTSSSARFFVI